MEPEVIRMYSSSPPPLDDGAEEDDDEFGEFGGFSGVSSSVSLTDFDSPGASRADVVPPNHFLPEKDFSNHVDGFADFSPGPFGKDRDSGEEISKSADAGLCSVEIGTSNDISTSAKPVINEDTVYKEEMKRLADQNNTDVFLNCSTAEVSSRTDIKHQTHQALDCNGGMTTEILTNGFAGFDMQDSLPQAAGRLAGFTDSVGQKHISSESRLPFSPPSPEDRFADFSSIPGADASADSTQSTEARETHREGSSQEESLTGQDSFVAHSVNELHLPALAGVSSNSDGAGETEAHPSRSLADGTESLSNGEKGSEIVEDTEQAVYGREHQGAECEAVHQPVGVPYSTDQADTQNGGQETGAEESDVCGSSKNVSSGRVDGGSGQTATRQEAEDEEWEGESAVRSTSASISEEFASFCQAASPDGLEDFGEFSMTNSAPSLPFSQGITAAQNLETTDLAEQAKEPEDEDFGDFGGAVSFESQDFADFSQPVVDHDSLGRPGQFENQGDSADVRKDPCEESNDEGDFGDFGEAHKPKDGEEEFADFAGSDGFADFSSARGSQDVGWNAFGEQDQSGGDSWAAFGQDQPSDLVEGETSSSTMAATSSGSPRTCRKAQSSFAFQGADSTLSPDTQQEAQKAPLVSRLERLFQASFHSAPVPEADEDIPSLKTLLELGERPSEPDKTLTPHGELLYVWRELQDVHDAYGLRYQWGGSHSNKKLLCSLGIDTRNILFTGQKKQPVIVPMYAASLGMLEPTKEPVKPISAAEKIASIAQAPPVSPEMSADQTQETLPPVQFDWSSSGLTNPLDASGGSTLLNLDFFGPVDDSSSSSTTTIPGVDPELYELTTAKLESSSTSSRVVDAFARLMSTVDKTSTSARKPRKDENLSEEAAKVIASLPDLSFMQAKVLMFPATLTPLSTQQEPAD
ncbi:aftiphilin isoform X1 [Lepisosteus oculatus]|uniref:aftiphilin isoform X1 n=1 Tax=Lepisosteus oculatus TaxID=7918 RepID=UPI0035F509E3